MQQNIATTQYDLGQVISTGWHIFWKNIRSILPIFLIVYLPINIALSFVPVDSIIETYGLRGFRIYLKLIQLTELLIGVLATMSLAKFVESSMLGKPITWRQALAHAFSRWGASIGTGLLAGVIIFGMIFLLIVPAIIWSLYYQFFVFVVALRGISGKEALDYSKGIVKGQWWRVCVYIFVINLLDLLCTLLVVSPFFFTPEMRILDIISNTLGDITTALFLCMTIVFFLNNDYLRNRNEQSHAEATSETTLHTASETHNV